MATESVDDRRAHLRGVTVTGLAALLGIAAGFAGLMLAGVPDPAEAARSPYAVYALAAVVAVQFPILRFSGLVDEFSAKDYLYIGFMTFAFWFVTLTVLLTAGVTLA